MLWTRQRRVAAAASEVVEDLGGEGWCEGVANLGELHGRATRWAEGLDVGVSMMHCNGDIC